MLLLLCLGLRLSYNSYCERVPLLQTCGYTRTDTLRSSRPFFLFSSNLSGKKRRKREKKKNCNQRAAKLRPAEVALLQKQCIDRCFLFFFFLSLRRAAEA